jgi:hypothetical protein
LIGFRDTEGAYAGQIGSFIFKTVHLDEELISQAALTCQWHKKVLTLRGDTACTAATSPSAASIRKQLGSQSGCTFLTCVEQSIEMMEFRDCLLQAHYT